MHNRWQQVEELYHAVLEHPPDERSAFLATRCADDLALLSEVEELLGFDGATENFIEQNALVVAAQQLEAEDLQNLQTIDRKSLLGERIGVYQILAPLGSGGMGEVYRAHDERLSRDVAIKILPHEFSQDPDRLRRFEQEARATSALNHPNILTVYDIASHDGVPCIVAELLEGEELRAKLKHGPLSVRQAIEYGQQITSGLAAAHEKGITHRDLKPENLFVTEDGRLKILDFGLAKLKPSTLSGTELEAPTPRPQNNPGTVMGTVMGTVGYMSPEQVRGQPSDHRADIFSFGVILYEMLTGRQAFLRETAADTDLAVLSEDPEEVAEINNKVPPELARIVRRCLEKKPERRFHSAHDLAFALESVSTQSDARRETDTASTAGIGSAGNLRLLKHERWMWIAAIALAALTASGAAWYFASRPAAQARLMKFSILPREKSSFDPVVISPDGRWLAFTAATGAKVQLWVRALDSTEAKALPGTEGARLPFWSPDSQHLGFFAGRKLRKIEVPDGRAVDLCDVGVGTGGAWGRDGVILFASLGAAGVSRVSDTGGAVTSVIRADLKRLETDYKDPSFLPDGRHFLYFNSSGEKEIRGVYVASLDGRVNKRLLGDDSNAVYASSGSGREYLLFGREGALMAQPFDTRQLRFTDEPFSVAGQVGRVLSTHARRNFSVSENGVLVLDSLPDRQRNQLIWVDRAGRKTNDVGGPQTLNPGRPRLSPDDARFIEDRFDLDRGSSDLWLTDVASGNVRPFTFDLATDLDAVWSPDGSRIAWCSNRAGQFDLYRRAASGEGKDELLHKGQDYPKHPTDWSRDGRFIIYGQPHPKTKGDVWVLPVGPPVGEPFVFLHSEANEGAAVLSPNGAWMAYQSDESGQYEVYVQSFPEGGGKRQISTGGGLAPHWRADGKEMFYHAPDGNLMAVTVKRGPSFEAARPLFPFRPAGTRFLPFYSVSGDGQRFLLSTIVDNDMTTPLTVMVNWSADLKR